MPTNESATAIRRDSSGTTPKTVMVLSELAQAAQPLKVGDHVTREPVIDGAEDNTYYRVRRVNPNDGMFEVDPNGPFERAWKGKLADYKPHHVYPGYWVPKKLGVAARVALKANTEAAKPKGPQSYEVTVNWYKEVIRTRVTASSEPQVLVVASHKLASSTLNAFTQRHVYQYLINNESKVTISLVR